MCEWALLLVRQRVCCWALDCLDAAESREPSAAPLLVHDLLQRWPVVAAGTGCRPDLCSTVDYFSGWSFQLRPLEAPPARPSVRAEHSLASAAALVILSAAVRPLRWRRLGERAAGAPQHR